MAQESPCRPPPTRCLVQSLYRLHILIETCLPLKSLHYKDTIAVARGPPLPTRPREIYSPTAADVPKNNRSLAGRERG